MSTHLNKKAQSSFEYLTIFILGFAMLIPFIYLFQNYSADSVERIQYTAINAIGHDIINTAEAVYYMGYPARLTLQENFPTGITNLTLMSNRSDSISILSFYTLNRKEIPFFTKIPLNASIGQTAYTEGLKIIVLETRNSTEGNFVQITFS
jgi:hypothetical protein